MKRNSKKQIYKIAESAIFIAMSVALSYCEFELMAFGGDISFCMVPLFILCYRNGIIYGITSGAVFGFLKCLLGGGIGYGLPSILLDYVLAYAAVGLAGIFKGNRKLLEVSALVGSISRFAIHFISGITLYKITVPTEIDGIGTFANPTVFSLVYNMAYMLPSTILCIIVISLLRAPLKRLDRI